MPMARRLAPPLSTLPLSVCPWRAFYPSPVRISAQTGRQLLDGFGGGNEPVKRRIELLDALDGLGRCGADAAHREARRRHRQHVPARNLGMSAHDVPPVESTRRVGKAKRAHAVAPEPGPCGHGAKSAFARPSCYTFFATGTGMPGIFTLTDPSMVRLVKNSVFQSSPPKAILVVAGWPWTMRPSFLPFGSRT